MKKVRSKTLPESQFTREDHLALKAEIDNLNFEYEKVVFDFSFEGAFVSCKYGKFDNFLHGKEEFADKFASAVKNIIKLSAFSPKQLMSDSRFRHCHAVSSDKSPDKIIKKILQSRGKSETYYKQLVGNEKIIQLGYQEEVRFVGMFRGNIFHVLFIDYHHDLYPDEKKNTRPRQSNRFSLMK